MTKPWAQVAASEGFKSLPAEQQDVARRQYFDDVVSPQVPAEQHTAAWDQFSTASGMGRRELPAGVTPSTAGGGRGNVHPGTPAPERAEPVQTADSQGNPLINTEPFTSTRSSVLEGMVIPEQPFNAAEAQRLSNRATAEATPMPGAPRLPELRPSTGPAPTSAATARGAALQDAALPVRAAFKAVSGVAQGAGGVMRAAGDMLDSSALAAAGASTAKGAAEFEQGMGEGAAPAGFGPKSPAAYLGRMAEGAVSSLGQSAAYAAAFGPQAVIPLMAVMTAGQEYDQARNAGLDPAAALAGAVPKGAFEAIGEKFSGLDKVAGAMGTLLKRGASDVAKKTAADVLVKSGIREIPGEVVTYLGQTGVDLLPGIGLNPDLTMGQFVDGLRDTVVQAGMMGGAMAAGGHTVHADPRIKRLRDAGETGAADLLQRGLDGRNADAELSSITPLADFAAAPEFQESYRALRTEGVKPVEAAGRSALASTFRGAAGEVGLSEKATSAALESAKKLPLDKQAGFLQRFVKALASRGAIPEADGIDGMAAAMEERRDHAMNAAIGATVPIEGGVRQTMDQVQALESAQGAAPGSGASVADNAPVSQAGENETQTAEVVTDPVAAAAPTPLAVIDDAAHEAATSPLNARIEPSQAQKEAGNYKVGRVKLQGLDISIENPIGSKRSGIGDDGKAWENELQAHYGYIRGTEGNDGDHVDTFIGPNPESGKVFVVDQVNKDGSFDEHKVMLGVDSLKEADELYHANYHDGWTGRGAITEMPIADFKAWVRDGVKTQPLGTIKPATTRGPDVEDARPAPQPPAATRSGETARGETPTSAGAAGRPAATGAEAGADDVEAAGLSVHQGRDGVPLAEGGKPFKTRLAADAARKLQPSMRVVRATGGYALTEKTPAQLAAQEKAARRLRNPQTSPTGEPIPAHAMIAAEGGLAGAERADMGMEGNVTVGNRKLFAGAGKGLSIERATEKLVEEGYLPDGATHDQARALIKRSITQPQYTAEGTERIADAEAQSRFDAVQQQDDAVAQIESLSDNQFEALDDADIPWDAPASTSTVEATMRALGFTDQEIEDATANSTRIQNSDSERSRGSDETAAGAAPAGDRDRTDPPRSDQESRSEAVKPAPESPPAPADAGVSVSADRFPSVSEFDRINVGPGGFIKPRVVAAGKPTFRETNVAGLDGRMLEDRNAVPFGGFVADRAELALGQGLNTGVQLVFRPDSVSGREHSKPMTGDLAGREYTTDVLAPRAVHGIAVYSDLLKTARGITRLRLKEQFDRATLPDGRLWFTRKGLPQPPAPLPLDMTWKMQSSGTLAVTGDEQTIRARLSEIPSRSLVRSKDGILVGKTQAAAALTILEGEGAGLTAPTQAEVLAQQERAAAGKKAEAATAAEADGKAKADAELGEFTLTGSDRAADVGAAGGQADIFSAAPARAAASKAAKIEDFGEKLEGARKDYAAQLKDAMTLDVKGVPLSESWPEPNYGKLLDGGGDPWAVAFVHAARDSVPTKPQSSWKLGRWVDSVNTVRDLANKLLSGLWMRDAVEPFVNSGTLSKLRGAIELYQQLGHETSLKGIEVNGHSYSHYKGQDYSPAKVIWTVDQKAKSGTFGNWPSMLAEGDTREAAIKAFVAKVKATPEVVGPSQKPTSFDIWSEARKYHVGKKIGREYASFKVFDTLAEARAYKVASQAELEAALAKYKATPFERKEANSPRVGADHRLGARVTSEVFAETFGFRGVQFGNYVESSKRQQDLNDAFDSLMDMAAVLGVPARALSLDGQLGLAFGARGQGGKNPAAAHYEPGKVVINLTKNNGAGSLAHEWFHAADNYFAKTGSTSPSHGMMTGGVANDAVRPEMQKAFADVVDAIRSTGMRGRSQALDARRSKPYWAEPHELSARAFETYIIAKLQDQNAANDYLANVVDPQVWSTLEGINGRNGESTYPYPTEKEMPQLREAFDAFFDTVQTKETEKGTAMFAKDFDAEAFRRHFGPAQGMTVEAAQKVVNRVSVKWKNGPRVIVVDTARDLPMRGIPPSARGLYTKNAVYVIASNNKSADWVARTLAHEAIAHHGLREALGEASWVGLMKNIQLAIKSGNKPLAKVQDYIREAYRDQNLSPNLEADEIAARVVEQAVDPVTGEFRPGFGFVKQAYARLAEWLRSIGINIPFTIAELHGMLTVAMKSLEVGKRTQGGGDMVVAAAQGEGDATLATGTPAGATGNLFAPNAWSMPDPTRKDSWTYELQDARIDLKRVQEAINKSGQDIAEQWDARLAETLYPGRVAHRSQTFLDAEAKPLLEAMARNKVPMDELADYLHARGAEERNKQIAIVNPKLKDGGSGTNTKGVLMTNQAARDYLAAVIPARKVVLDAMAKRVDAITAGTRALLVSEGLEKQSTIDAWEAVYQNYVPMFRDEAENGTPSHPTGSGFTVKGPSSQRATGSTKEVTNILAHVLMQREAVITRAEKNRVALALYGQALSHPNPDFWTTIKPSMDPAAIAAELVAMGVDPLTAQVGMEGVPTIRGVDPVTNKVVDRPNPIYKNLPGAIPLKVNGEDRVLMLNVTTPRGMRLAEALKNLDGLTKFDLANSIIGKSTRWLAAVNTQYNPAFGLANLTRDVLEGAINLGSTELRGKALRVLAQVPLAIQGTARELAGSKAANPWGKLYAEFVEAGGQTGFKENFRDAQDRANAVQKELTSLSTAGKLSPGRAAHAMLDLLDGFNTTLENAVRLSAYKVAKEEGISTAKAARLARELTVDFNRKGRAGREIGPLYAFFNAAVQGIERSVRTLAGPTGGRIIAGGLSLGVIQALMLTAAGYDDDDIPEFVKTRAFIIPLLGDEKKYIAIPMPLGFLTIPNTGRVLTELTLNGGKDMAKRVTAAIGEIAGSFNPLGGGNVFTADGALKTVAPTLVDPLIEIGFNKNFAGSTIEKQPYGGETDGRPGIARTKEATQRQATGQAYMEISKAINTLTGGSDYERGLASPTPERVRYIAQTVGGGVLRELEKTINASVLASRGEKVKPSAIPVAGRFYGEVDGDQVAMTKFYKNSRELDTLQSSLKAAMKAGDGAAVMRMFEDHPEAVLTKLNDKTQADIAQLNKLAVSVVRDPAEMKEIDRVRVDRMAGLNEAVKQMEEASGKMTLGQKLRAKTAPKVAVAN